MNQASSSGSVPRILRVLTTNACNHHCLFCHNEGQRAEERADLGVKEFRAVVRATAQLGIQQVQFSGGEPLLNPEFRRLVEVTRHEAPRLGMGLATNGSLLTPALIEFLTPLLNNIRINLPTLDSLVYEELTGARDLARILDVIGCLRHHGARAGINSVYWSQDEAQVLELIRFAAEQNLDVKFLEWIPFGQGEHARPIFDLCALLARLASKQIALSLSVTAYEVPIAGSTVLVRVIHSSCLSKDRTACEQYGEIRLLPGCVFQPCLISDRNNVRASGTTQETIRGAFREAAKLVGRCPAECDEPGAESLAAPRSRDRRTGSGLK